MEYEESEEHSLKQIVRTHRYHTNSTLLQPVNNIKKSFQSETKQVMNLTAQNIREEREGKGIYGQFPCSLDEKLVDKEQSYRWLKFGDIKRETESTTVTAQDQALSTDCFRKKL
jgi:CRISPR/Cas system-associated protein Cas7 (RAMP superfamily)